MTNELRKYILKIIKHNIVCCVIHSDTHYEYFLVGKKETILLRADCYDDPIPRISIYINNRPAGHINHFARTETQIQYNNNVALVVSKLFEQYGRQQGLMPRYISPKDKQFIKFLRQNSLQKG